MHKKNKKMTTYLTIAIVIIALVAVIIVWYTNHLKAKARGYAKEAKLFHERLLQLTDPSHHFTDEELHKLKRDFAPLLYSVNELYNNPFITNEYLDKIGLGDFLEERKLVNHQQYLNNIRQSPQS